MVRVMRQCSRRAVASRGRRIMARRTEMAKKSFVNSTQDTVIGAAKTSAEGVTILAAEVVGAAAVAASDVIAQGVKSALHVGEVLITKKVAARKPKRPVKRDAAA